MGQLGHSLSFQAPGRVLDSLGSEFNALLDLFLVTV